ncbi:xanthine dehydrogenase molybdopterin binding subunit [Vibrio sp. WJH972]
MRKLTSLTPSEITLEDKPVGKPIQHESATKQVSGEALFIDDYPNSQALLHAAVITSNIAKGVITSIDLSDVEACDGVVCILDESDIPGLKDIGAIYKGDPLLAIDNIVHYFGQPIAVVLATSHNTAWKAAQLAKVEYDNSDNVTTNHLSNAHDNQVLLPPHQMGTPISNSIFDGAYHQVQGDLWVGGQEHFYLETQISIAEVTEDRGIFLRCSTQHPAEIQKLVAEVLAIDFNQVTVDMRRMGGGFGGKESQAGQWACLAALGAYHTKKSVKIRLPRSVDMTSTGKRHPFYQRYHLATDQHGKILASQIEINGLCGHSPDLSDAIVDRAMFHTDNAYSLGDAHIEGHRLKTDTVSHTAFRGFGGPQGMIIIEKAMQQLSITTAKDALDLRYLNLYNADSNTTPYGMKVTQTETMYKIMRDLEQQSDYRRRREEIERWNLTNPILKKGLALTPVKFGISFTAKHLNQAGALLHIYTDGSVQVSHGGTEMGQGLHTKIQQIVAQSLGINLSRVLVTSTRTDKVPNSSPTAASSGADLNGMAAHNAAITLKTRLLEFISSFHNTDKPLQIEGEKVIGLDIDLTWPELIQQAYMNRISLSTTGFYQTPKIHYDRDKAQGRPFYYFALGASCSEVTIDTLTGELSVERVDIIHDVGQSLNPAIDEGQIEGAFIQGMGWLTTEELVWKDDGQLMSNSPMNYKIPTIGDYPKSLNIHLFDEINPEYNIYRSKAVGEPPFMHAISVWCAIYDAVASVSGHTTPPLLHAPATGEAILSACEHQLSQLNQEE